MGRLTIRGGWLVALGVALVAVFVVTIMVGNVLDPPTAPRRAQLAGWYAKAQPAIAAMARDSENVGDATKVSPAATESACRVLQRAVATARRLPALPGPAPVADNWAFALTDYQAGAHDCVVGIAAVDAALVGQAGREMASGNVALIAATTALETAG